MLSPSCSLGFGTFMSLIFSSAHVKTCAVPSFGHQFNVICCDKSMQLIPSRFVGTWLLSLSLVLAVIFFIERTVKLYFPPSGTRQSWVREGLPWVCSQSRNTFILRSNHRICGVYTNHSVTNCNLVPLESGTTIAR